MTTISTPAPGRAAGRTRPRRVPRWLRGRLSVQLSLLFLAVLVVLAVLGPSRTPGDATTQSLVDVLVGPGNGHLLGTDDLGRDVFARTLAGVRSAVIGPALIALLSWLIGSVLGLFAAYRGGRVDALLMRWVDFMWALPAVLVIIVVIGVFGGGYTIAVGVLVVLTCPFDTRLIRGAALTQRNLPYVEAARAIGVSDAKIMFGHIWPNVLGVGLANAFLNFGYSLLALSGLAYLGLGSPPGAADWGVMLSQSGTGLYQNVWVALAPAAMIVLACLSVNVVGDWIQERHADGGTER
ncbi:ABC transporter permease [Nocardioides sp. GY 10127]|uniref:ABC transporter permease n=1 Tax=Nocardioides sp. GY 10127 TaxID=2569762 RepID=UPI0010A8F8D3|nr:ABC transporter permease [Nocardioides sp. GY 10127]TIC86456.1 ABC transporter permease [Nocardioides sp. GY 10127]